MNEWIAELFSPENLDRTVALLAGAQSEEDPADAAERRFRQRIAIADATMVRLQRALEAGWDPEALTSQYNAATAEKKAGLAGLEALEPAERLSAADIRAMVQELGAVKAVLDQADRGDLADLYGALKLEVSYNYKTRVADVSIRPAPRVVSVCPRRNTHLNHTPRARRYDGRSHPVTADLGARLIGWLPGARGVTADLCLLEVSPRSARAALLRLPLSMVEASDWNAMTSVMTST
ncbi:hypothetical protein AB0E63_03390 [Kribbella sp. NPDC026596]|uniref:hypothetical protein n=1 Tax=Kribbella sp. NPDC026596 TaxID=3155122 RepID=UPI003401730F